MVYMAYDGICDMHVFDVGAREDWSVDGKHASDWRLWLGDMYLIT
jgi:hypothetical protein